jgi:hypothetical protein
VAILLSLEEETASGILSGEDILSHADSIGECELLYPVRCRM